ncbi:MAG: cytochrome c [Gammaproteobacteria bacterium]
MIKKAPFAFLFLLSACDGGPSTANTNPLHLPPPGFVGDSIVGKALYNQNCQSCHGASGLGTDQGPPLVSNMYKARRHADLAFHLAVKNGVRAHHWKYGGMKPIEKLSPEEAGHIIRYVREIQENSSIQ